MVYKLAACDVSNQVPTGGALSVKYFALVDAVKDSSTVPTRVAPCSFSCPLLLPSDSGSLHGMYNSASRTLHTGVKPEH